MSIKKAAFFDRDGTLIKDVNYLKSLSEVEILPGAVELCLDLQKKDYVLFVITNQSGISRRVFEKEFVEETHRYLSEVFSKLGVNFRGFYYCPHLPEHNCNCRKPLPGMILKAASEHKIDLTSSLMFGDKETDLKAGEAAGCKSFFIQEVFAGRISYGEGRK